MLVDVLQISPHTVVERTRRLPLAGEVWVSLGDEVTPEMVVAEATFLSKPIVLDIGLGLGVSAEEADACALRKPGDVLKAGDLIAQYEGPLTRVVRSPVDGTLLELGRGKAILAAGRQVRQARAGMLGVVADIFPEFGVRLRAEGALLQGEWGNGRAGSGVLTLAEDATPLEDETLEGQADAPVEAPKTELEEAVEAPSVEETEAVPEGKPVLAAASVQALDWFEEFDGADWAGVVAGWLNPALVARAAGLDIPFIALFGIGAGPLDPVAWEILQSRAGELCSLNAAQADPFQGTRPELVIPGEGTGAAEALGFTAELAQGQRVWLLSGAAAGQTGQVLRLEGDLVFENGLVLPAATVQLVTGEQIQVPQANLVVLG